MATRVAVNCASLCVTLALSLPSLAAEPSGAAEWSRFRGATGMGTSNATGLPVSWGKSENIA
jgi:hypothetical protein